MIGRGFQRVFDKNVLSISRSRHVTVYNVRSPMWFPRDTRKHKNVGYPSLSHLLSITTSLSLFPSLTLSCLLHSNSLFPRFSSLLSCTTSFFLLFIKFSVLLSRIQTRENYRQRTSLGYSLQLNRENVWAHASRQCNKRSRSSATENERKRMFFAEAARSSRERGKRATHTEEDGNDRWAKKP